MAVEKKNIPENMTVEEEMAFWESHDVTDYIDDTEAEKIELSSELTEKIKSRSRLKSITLRLSEQQTAEAKRIAAKKEIGYQTLIRTWVSEAIDREKKRDIV
jgi:predicted DNA binding CopG/RHH family protein